MGTIIMLCYYDVGLSEARQSGFLSRFLTFGQTLPTQRLAHSVHGGLFQPTMRECIRLLSDPHGNTKVASTPLPNSIPGSFPESDPFSSSELTYTTNWSDSFPAPSAYPSRRHSWIHIFPEGMIHQHPQKAMRYFKWGIARLILEAEPCPDVLPMWIEGCDQVMNEKREWPRPIPRPGKHVDVSFGELVDREKVLEPFRERWRNLKAKSIKKLQHTGMDAFAEPPLGEVWHDDLKYGAEAEELRIEVTLAMRNEVLKVRRSRGFPDEDPKRSLAETWRREGRQRSGQEGEMMDSSVVKGM